MGKGNMHSLESSACIQQLHPALCRGKRNGASGIGSLYVVPAAEAFTLFDPYCRRQVNSCSESSSQPLHCLHTLLWWIQSTSQTQSKCMCQRQGRGSRLAECLAVYVAWITADANCMTYHVFQAWSLFPPPSDIAPLVRKATLYPRGTGHPGVVGGICVTQPQTGKMRIKGLNPYHQLLGDSTYGS